MENLMKPSKLLIATLITLPLVAATASAQNRATLFGETTPGNKASAQIAPPASFVKRQKAVSINFNNLNQRAAATVKELDVQLFDGKVVTFTLDRVEQRSARSYTWYGYVKGAVLSQAVLTVVDGAIAGSVLVVGGEQRGQYEIHTDAKGDTFLRELDASKLPGDHGAGLTGKPLIDMPISARAKTSTLAALAVAAPAKKIDVMVLYSNQAAAAAGSTPIDAQVQLAIALANNTFANSRVTTRVRLVHSGPVSYNENGDMVTDLKALGALPSLNQKRNLYGADVVVVLDETTTAGGVGYCGVAAAIGATANSALVVVNRNCATKGPAVVHEMGHLFGARHEVLIDPSTTPYSYGHGFTDTAHKFFTVMSYGKACDDAGITGCLSYPLFSTPDLTYSNVGTPAASIVPGNATANNRKVVQDSTDAMANFLVSKAFQETGVYSGPLSNYTITQSTDKKSYTVTAKTGSDGTAVFDQFDAFRVKFADASIAFDVNGSAGQTFRLYQAAFNRVPDQGGLGYWIAQRDNGLTLEQMAGHFISSPEFTAMYGTNPSNADFVLKVYNNVLHRAPETAGYNYWLGQLNAGLPRSQMLAYISESTENIAGVAPALVNGIRYTPFAAAKMGSATTASPFAPAAR
jgi:hypothetical protein